jgi:hypothetical protein
MSVISTISVLPSHRPTEYPSGEASRAISRLSTHIYGPNDVPDLELQNDRVDAFSEFDREWIVHHDWHARWYALQRQIIGQRIVGCLPGASRRRECRLARPLLWFLANCPDAKDSTCRSFAQRGRIGRNVHAGTNLVPEARRQGWKHRHHAAVGQTNADADHFMVITLRRETGNRHAITNLDEISRNTESPQ